LTSWNKVSRNKVLISYNLASISAVVSGLITMIYMLTIILDGPKEISSSSEILYPIYAISSKMGILNIGNIISFLSSFIFMWIGSAIVLRHYTLKIPKSRYI